MSMYAKIISIHVPREGHDYVIPFIQFVHNAFQSTCPARGTTTNDSGFTLTDGISIHVPREGHDLMDSVAVFLIIMISIHVPREGHDHSKNLQKQEQH